MTHIVVFLSVECCWIQKVLVCSCDLKVITFLNMYTVIAEIPKSQNSKPKSRGRDGEAAARLEVYCSENSKAGVFISDDT